MASDMMQQSQQLPDTPRSTDSTSNQLEQMENDVIIDIQAIVQSKADDLMFSRRCIFKVPHAIRDLKEDAYTPRVVSIGPFHYGHEPLQDMESHKQVLFKTFIANTATSLDNLVNFAKDLEPGVRTSYASNIKLSKKELVKVMIVDAGFIIQLFMMNYKERMSGSKVEFSQPWLMDAVRKDLLLLENQLPFFFLEDLFTKAFTPELCQFSFLDLTYDFFEYFNIQKLESADSHVSIKHFTDLLRLFHLPTIINTRRPFTQASNDYLSYSANQLQEAGVKFEVSRSNCLLELKFKGHTLEIPEFLVDDLTEIVFRNMIAFEKCHYPFESYITDYALILDCLINSSKDVDVLVYSKVICYRNLADTKDVAKILNGLCKNVIQEDFNLDFCNICRRLNKFYQSPWHKKKATLRRDYCSTPWQTVASFAGIILLILTLVQTICSILQVA